MKPISETTASEGTTRTRRMARILVVTAVLIALIVVTFASYTRRITSRLYAIGADNVEETYREVGQLFNQIADSTFRDLRFLHEHMRETASTYEERAAVIQQFREEIGFTYYYLLDDEGNYAGGKGSGNFGFGSGRMTFLRNNETSMLDATLPDGENIVLFALRVNPIIYNDHTYTAIAIAYNEKDMGEALKVSAYDGTSYPYILTASGRTIITSDRTTEESKTENLITYLESGARIENYTREEVIAAFNAHERMTCVVHDDMGAFYLTFQPLGIQDYTLAAWTPVEAVDASIDALRSDTTTMITIAVALIFLLVIYGLTILYLRNLRHKDVRIEGQEAEIEAQNRALEERNGQLETALEIAQAANQAKTNFLSNVSHDIRTPMNAIIGFATLAEREIDDRTRVQEYLGKIQASSHHLLNLINDVLDYSKIEAGRMSLRTENMNIETIAERVDAMIRPQAEEKGITLTREMDCGIRCIVEVDELRLTQVLVNILSNAVKYTPEGGQITVRTENEIDGNIARYRFIIRDNGIGMNESYLEDLFNPFTREEKTTTNKVQGTGLGMAITKNLIDLMGGTIDVASQKDVGTTFTVRADFRLVQVIEEEQAPESAPAEEISIAGMHILIAEDNELNAEIITELLQMEGCEVDVTENGRLCAERFESAEEGTYDLILMDVQMPEMNGYEATQAIRASGHPGAATIPIIAMTANAFTEDKKDALDAGMNAHVAKPIDMQVLKKAIRQNWTGNS